MLSFKKWLLLLDFSKGLKLKWRVQVDFKLHASFNLSSYHTITSNTHFQMTHYMYNFEN
jgi:hypothetical protein